MEMTSPEDLNVAEQTNELESLKSVYENDVAFFNSGDMDAYFDDVHEDIMYFSQGSPEPRRGKANIKASYQQWLPTLEEFRWEADAPHYLLIGNTGIMSTYYTFRSKLANQPWKIQKGRATVVYAWLNERWTKISAIYTGISEE